nr:hypothetical protein [uncultured Dyadobacter sp.]
MAVSNFRQHLLALWQVSRNISFVFLMLAVCAALLILPDQAQDMVDEFGQQNIFEDYFMLKSLSVCIWAATAWQCSRIILLSPVDVDVQENEQASKFWMLWMPRVAGLLAGLTLALAFAVDGHGWHSLVIVGYSLISFAGFIILEKINSKSTRYEQPVRQTYVKKINAQEKGEGHRKTRRTTIPEDLKELFNDKLIGGLLYVGFVSMALLFILFLIPLFTSSAKIGQFFSAVYIVLLGCSFYCGLGSLVVYFSDFRYRPIALLIAMVIYFISQYNDNTQINESPLPPANRTEIKDQFARWLAARKVAKGDSIPLIIVATEGGGIRGTVWTSQLLFRLNEHIPGFDKHTFAISGVSGGGVGAAFYLAYQRDKAARPGDTLFAKNTLDRVLKEDFISPVIGGYMFNESIQLIIPCPLDFLERTKRLEDAWAQAYHDHFNVGDAKPRIDTFDQPFTSLYQNSDSCQLPSLILNGTLAETGQKTIVSNLIIHGKQNFKDVVDILHLTQKDMPYKTAATMCSRFPFVTTGGLVRNADQQSAGIRSGHVTDGGNFDNTGMETSIQLLTALLPGIDSLRNDGVHVIPYVLFFKNSSSEELSFPNVTHAQRRNRGFGVPLNSFFNPWNRGSDTRDAIYNSLTPFTNPQIRYMSFKLDYRVGENKTLRLPLGWSISDSATNHIHNRADVLIDGKISKGELKVLKQLVTLKKPGRKIPLTREFLLSRIPDLPLTSEIH